MTSETSTSETGTPRKPQPTPVSRAVIRTIEPGNSAMCPTCGLQVKFQARTQGKQVICNVYTDGKWKRVVHYHLQCYDDGGQPYGPPA